MVSGFSNEYLNIEQNGIIQCCDLLWRAKHQVIPQTERSKLKDKQNSMKQV